MEIRVNNKLRKRDYIGFTYKGIPFLRTSEKVWVSFNDGDRWKGYGRGGYEYVIMDAGKVKVFDTLKEVKTYISAYVKLMEAKQAMNAIMENAEFA